MALTKPEIACENVLLSLKVSRLTFSVQETPYSCYITIRKKFVKSFQQQQQTEMSPVIVIENRGDIEDISKENKELKHSLDEKEAEMSEFKETIMILENKVEHAEAELIKHFKETKDLKNIYNREKEESSVLKGVI